MVSGSRHQQASDQRATQGHEARKADGAGCGIGIHNAQGCGKENGGKAAVKNHIPLHACAEGPLYGTEKTGNGAQQEPGECKDIKGQALRNMELYHDRKDFVQEIAENRKDTPAGQQDNTGMHQFQKDDTWRGWST